MLDGYHILTLTHRDAPLGTIANAVVPDADEQLLHALKARFGWNELLYLATCNRVSFLFYTQAPVSENLPTELLQTIRPDLSAAQLESTAAPMRLLHGADAIRHLFEVAASIDSLVLGEREILRQLREAYDRNQAWGLTGDHIRLLLRFTIETAKAIYTQTKIGEKALSVVALAFNAMLKNGLQPEARVLLVGAGETNTLFAKFLVKYGYTNVTVFNRTLENAQLLAGRLHGRALPLDALPYYSEGFDILVVCTAATRAIITPALYQSLLAGENTPKTVVDLSVPHNVDARIPEIFPVQYVEIEGLREMSQENLAYREQERAKARPIIEERIRAYRDLWHERQVERALAHIPDEVRAVKDRAVNEVFDKEFASLDPEAQALMMRMLDYMEKKCVAIPMKAAKAIALHPRKQEHV